MRTKAWRTISLVSIFLTSLAPFAAPAQERVNGAIPTHNFLGQPVLPDEITVSHGSEFKGAHRVAISAFNVAFPSENHFSSSTRSHSFYYSLTTSSSMSTAMSGLDHATEQRIADKAYALFVKDLTAMGYEVVDQAELARLAPEFAKWNSVPNYSQGRYGTYVAPSGQALRFLQGDQAKRDTSGPFAAQAQAFRVLDMPQAFARSPYIARDANLGIIAVTLVVDYGVYSSGGSAHGFGHHATTEFQRGVTIAAGNISDHGSMLEYWGTHSGGFPAYAFLQQPIRSELPFGRDADTSDSTLDASIIADPPKFEIAADEVVGIAVPKLVSVMAAAR